MLNPPEDLDERTIIDALAVGWDVRAVTLEYRAVGFGSHHWLATDAAGDRRFVTLDDLRTKRRDGDTVDGAFDRLTRAFTAVRALHDDARLHLVVPPLSERDGTVVRRLDERYSMVVHPFLEGTSPGSFDGYDTDEDRAAVLDLLVELHTATATATAPHADTDDLALPHRTDIEAALAQTDRAWDAGPHGEAARSVLVAQAAPLRVLLDAYERLAEPVRRDPSRMVITHGEPHAGNVLVVDGRHRLLDWDTVLIAPPERDLWMLEPGDGSILAAYGRATGIEPSTDVVDLYRLWFDLDEIGGYLALFREPHGDDANSTESLANLRRVLDPEERWPSFFA